MALIDAYQYLDDAIAGGDYDKEIESFYFKAEGVQDAPETKSAKDITWASGCTAVSAIVTKDKVIVANAGDSRAVLCKTGENEKDLEAV